MSAFSSLKDLFRPRDTTIALPTDPFVVIDRDRAIAKLKLDERGERNGASEFPPSDAADFDDVEADIVAEMTEHATRAQIEASTSHRLYGERLAELAMLRDLSRVTGSSSQALGDFRTTVISREGRLALAKDAIRESYQELAAFKREHALARPAHRGLLPVYAGSTIGISWLVESAFNTAFLRVNDDQGLIGGFVAAMVVAGVNVFFSALVGRFWWPYLRYKYPFQRRLAFAGCGLWAVGLMVWNLLAGHFRDAKVAGLANPEGAALRLFAEAPWQFDTVNSYGLLAAGFVFAALAATAAFRMDDPYPGYGAIYRRHEDRCEAYADEIELAFEELRETRDDAVGDAERTRDELTRQFRDRGDILAQRETHRLRYREHQDYLETIGNTLLAHYRAANVRARSTPAPETFGRKWSPARTELPLDPAEPSIETEVLRAQDAIRQSIETIGAAYEAAIGSFEHLDRIKASLADG